MAEAKKESKVKKTAAKEKQAKEAELIVGASPAKELRAKSQKLSEDTEKLSAENSKPSADVTKAGKHSAKAVKEAEEKQAKEARKADKTTTDPAETKKSTKKPTRSKVERAGKKFREASKLVDTNKIYELAEALDLATKTSTTKFDATVELHINLGVDPRQADQNVRGTVGLPEGTGKSARVAVFSEEDDDKKALAAGADLVGADKILANLEKEQIDFDILVATPSMMSKLAKHAKLLGPKGLMPNPKSGTVTPDVAKAVKEAKAGRVEYRVDTAGIVHLGIGKVSFGKDKLGNNAKVIVDAIKAAKPASLKGSYIKTVHVSSTMGPSIKVNPSL